MRFEKRGPQAWENFAAAPLAPLISGGAMFGVGWALGGFCPGPALAAWTTNGDLVWFVPAMLISMWISSRIRG